MKSRFFITSICICACLTACKVTKQSKTDYQYTAENYAHTEHKSDTTYIYKYVFVHDTITIEVEKESQTGVEFVAGGGTFNLSTGEATGVVRVTSSEREKSLENRISDITQQLEWSEAHVAALQDSIRSIDASGSEQTFTETKAQNFWWLWLVVGIVAGAASIVALKKIPYTSWMMKWL